VRRVIALLLVLGVAALVYVRSQKSSGHSTASTTAPARAGGSGGVLRIGVSRPATLDPAQARTVEQMLLDEQLFSALASYDHKTLEPKPSLAASWTASPDQRGWDFALRPGATFANGRPVVAADVKYSLERVARKGSNSTGADQLALVSGYKAFAVDGKATGLDGVTTPSADVVHIALDAPLSVLPSVLASPVFSIVPREAVETPSPPFGEQPVGSGPFVLKSRTPDHLVLARAPGATVRLDGIEVSLFDSVAASYQAFTAGQLDYSRVPPEQVEAAASRYGSANFKPNVAELFYAFNLKSPKFADVRFREAIVRGVNRDAIVKVVYQGTVRRLDGVVVKGVPGQADDPCGERCQYDPGKARALLAAAFPAGHPVPEVTLDFDDDPTQQKVAETIQASLQQIGVKANLQAKPLAAYEGFVAGNDKELFRLGWIAPYPSPDAFLAPLFATGSTLNASAFSLPAVDAAIAAARAEPDPSKRLAHYQDAEKAVMEQVPLVPIAQFLLHAVVSSRAHGLEPRVTGTFDTSTVRMSGH